MIGGEHTGHRCAHTEWGRARRRRRRRAMSGMMS